MLLNSYNAAWGTLVSIALVLLIPVAERDSRFRYRFSFSHLLS